MGNSTIGTEFIVLKDNWPEPPPTEHIQPMDFTNGVVAKLPGQNVEIPAFDLGTKVRLRGLTTASKFSECVTLIYLKLGTQNPDDAIAAGSICVPEDSNGTKTTYQVTNDGAPTANEESGCAAVALAAMTNSYCGWFWCAGRAPLDIAPGLDTDFYTDTSVLAGYPVSVVATDIGNSELGLAKAVTLTGSCGWSVAADVE